MNDTAKLEAIDAAHASVPAFKCIPGCHDCCGPVLMTRLEWKRIVRVMTPPGGNKSKVEHELQSKASATYDSNSLACPMLTQEGRCGCYVARPAICRLFGSVDTPRLICPHGGAPEVKLSNAQCLAILTRVEQLGR